MLVVAGALGREFGRSSELLRQQRLMHMQREEKDRKERTDKARDDLSEFVDSAMLVVPAAEVMEFRVELDLYDTATIAALDQNRIALEQVQERLDDLLDRAHVLEDGRRVFKTEDGTQVFDEFGLEVDASLIGSDDIADTRPTWETYKVHFDEEARLRQEQTELLAYQDRLDMARERLDSGEITSVEFEELKDDIRDSVPDAVRGHIPGLDEEQELASSQPGSEPVQAASLDINAVDIPVGQAPGVTR